MKRNITMHWFPYLLFIAFVIAMLIGWVANIVKLFNTNFDSAVSAELIMRIVGIFVAPFGSIMGYL